LLAGGGAGVELVGVVGGGDVVVAAPELVGTDDEAPDEVADEVADADADEDADEPEEVLVAEAVGVVNVETIPALLTGC
jgi:hypothetical protein